MKTTLFLVLLAFPFSISAQDLSQEQQKAEQLLLKYTWFQPNTVQPYDSANKLDFSRENGEGSGRFRFGFSNRPIRWEWADRKATALRIYIQVASHSPVDTIMFTDIRLKRKKFFAQFTSTLHWYWGPASGTMKRIPLEKTKEEETEPQMELKETRTIEL